MKKFLLKIWHFLKCLLNTKRSVLHYSILKDGSHKCECYVDNEKDLEEIDWQCNALVNKLYQQLNKQQDDVFFSDNTLVGGYWD